MRIGMTENLQKMVNRHGSVLKAYRARGGGAAGAIAGGVTLFISGVLLGGVSMLGLGTRGLVIGAAFWAPGLLLIILGTVMRNKRINGYLDYYQKETGYSAGELQAADRELMGPGVGVIAGKTNRAKEEVMFMITEHYFMSVWPNKGCYLVKLEDIVAAFHSCQIPFISMYLEGLYVISKRDVAGKAQVNPLTKKQYNGYYNAIMSEQQNAEAVCMEAVEEIAKRVPHVIRHQHIVVNGENFDLLSMNNWQADWARILGA